jgi:hypothetical protein
MKQPRISAKKLGMILEGTTCERCRWFLLRGQPPYKLFPAVFNYLDRWIKHSVRAYFDEYEKMPPWFGTFSSAEAFRDVGRLHHFEKASGILLTGEPDELLIERNGYAAVVDYKVTRVVGDGKGGLYAVYQIQLAAYKYLCNCIDDMPEVNRVGLVYLDPSGAGPASLEPVDDEGLLAYFKGSAHIINLPSEDVIPKSLAKIRCILDQPTPPAPAEGCADCRLVGEIIKLLGAENFVDHDRIRLVRRVESIMRQKGVQLLEALASVRYQDLKVEPDGDSVRWDWLGEDEEW